MKKLLVLSMLSVFSFSAAAYACDGKDHKASTTTKSSKGDSPSAKKDSQDKAKGETSTKS